MSHGKVEDKTKFKNKFPDIEVLIFCEINDNTQEFYLVSSEVYSQPCEKKNVQLMCKLHYLWFGF